MTKILSTVSKTLQIVLLLLIAAGTSFAQSSKRPNFIIIIADDMSWNDCGAYGHKTVRTPNLDKLAREGMRFDKAFVTASSCSPSRASLITGRYPHNTQAEQLHWALPAEQVTFVELLKASGYWTAAAGKWHLGAEVKNRFDVVKEPTRNQPSTASGTPATGNGKPAQTMPGGGDISGAEDWLPTLRNRPRDKPFFLWLAAFDPHREYHENSIPRPHESSDAVVPPYLPDVPAVRKDFALYYDEITRLDSNVGRVLAELDDQGVASNTFILFISDNGRPFPRAKTTLYDSGIRTPWIMRWTGRIKPGSSSASLVSTVDVAPTIMELANLKSAPTFQGKSFASLLVNPQRRIHDYIYAERNWHDFDDHSRAARSSKYKYIRNYYTDISNTPPADAVRSLTFRAMRRLRDEGALTPAQMVSFTAPRATEELYDTEADPYEMRNLAADRRYAKTLAEHRRALDDWQRATEDRVPAARTPDEFDRETGDPLPNHRTTRQRKKL